MTYCVGLCLQDGLVLLSDTRTNAGPDNIASFPKMHVAAPGDRVIAIMTSGNLAVTQAVVARVMEGSGVGPGEPFDTLFTVKSMYEAAELIAGALTKICSSITGSGAFFDASIIVAGQIAGRRMRMFQIYSAGNFIESSPDTPFFQIGETKYGKPILDRVAHYDTPLEDAVKLALISMDSTLRSNFSVGLPMDLLVYRRDTQTVAVQERISEDNAYFRSIRDRWSDALRAAYRDLPAPPWMRS
ncbi:peptidase [Terricaulis sp.]|uniref:peptidase n=1 Tax=Terricaulis sp. TaxID=2768686 RepID=UPI002AC6E953|nr:peptidase [Terricaulis sp.]MDZ4690802.1 peptidase [Terricaulis sp.]